MAVTFPDGAPPESWIQMERRAGYAVQAPRFRNLPIAAMQAATHAIAEAPSWEELPDDVRNLLEACESDLSIDADKTYPTGPASAALGGS